MRQEWELKRCPYFHIFFLLLHSSVLCFSHWMSVFHISEASSLCVNLDIQSASWAVSQPHVSFGEWRLLAPPVFTMPSLKNWNVCHSENRTSNPGARESCSNEISLSLSVVRHVMRRLKVILEWSHEGGRMSGPPLCRHVPGPHTTKTHNMIQLDSTATFKWLHHDITSSQHSSTINPSVLY